MLQKKRIQRAFSRACKSYENNAALQKEVAQELIACLCAQALPAPLSRILEVGVGTGYLACQLRHRVPSTPIIGCDIAPNMLNMAKKKQLPCLYLNAADAENLPYRDNSFDLVVSSLTYQWVNHFEQAFSELYRLLKKGGQVYIATLGPATLKELRDSFSHAYLSQKGDWPTYLQEFPPSSQIQDIVKGIGFEQVNINSQLRRKTYSSAHHILRTLRDIGAANASPERPKGLASRKILTQMEQIYQQNYSHPEGVYATYEIVWLRAVKK